MTFFAKPTNYKKGDRWVLVEDTPVRQNFYKKGKHLRLFIQQEMIVIGGYLYLLMKQMGLIWLEITLIRNEQLLSKGKLK